MAWILRKMKQPSTYAGVATVCAAIAQTDSFKTAIPLILAGLGSIIVNA